MVIYLLYCLDTSFQSEFYYVKLYAVDSKNILISRSQVKKLKIVLSVM